MAATKITSLTPISTIDTAVDPLPIVDVSDTSQSASGTTKKVTVDQIESSIFGATGSKAIVVDNVAALKALTVASVDDGQLFLTRGYYTENDGGQGSYIYDSTSAAADNGGTVIAPTSGAGRYLLQYSGELNVKQFGAKTDGTNSFSAFQSALAAITQKGQLTVPSGTYTINSGITVNVSLVKIVGQNAKLSFASMPTNQIAITFTGSGVSAPYYQSDGGIEGLEIRGPGPYGTCVGIHFTSPSESGPSHSNVSRCTINQFKTGVTLGNNAYLINFDNCDIHDCDVGVEVPNGVTNTGEGIRFVDCTIFNCLSWALKQDNVTTFTKLIGTSIDYNAQGLYIGKGRVDLLGAHFESRGPGDSRQIYVPPTNGANDGVNINISGGLYYRGIDAVACTAPIIDLQGYARCTIVGAEIHDYATKSVAKVNNGPVSDLVWIGGRFVFDPAYTSFTSSGTYNIRVNDYNSGRWSVSGIDSQTTVFAGSGLSANSGVIAYTGNITASVGNIVATAGNISATAGNISASAGSVSALQITSTDGVFSNNEKFFTISSLNTWTNIGTGLNGGLYIFRDSTSGGVAVFAADASGGAVQINNGITGFQMQFDGVSQMQARVTSGSAPRSIKFSLIRTNAS